MATASEVLAMTRSLLNDDLATHWTDAVLLSKLGIAHREMQSELQLHGIPAIKTVTAVINVPALAVDLGVSQPADLIEPISMEERDVGGSNSDFSSMWEVGFIPSINIDSTLIYWAWIGEKIKLVGATQAREVRLKYKKGLAIPSKVGDSVGFILGELFLAPRIAYFCGGEDRFAIQARGNLENVIRANVKGAQGIAHRRRPYRWGGRSVMGHF